MQPEDYNATSVIANLSKFATILLSIKGLFVVTLH